MTAGPCDADILADSVVGHIFILDNEKSAKRAFHRQTIAENR